ncbi:multidrug/spermidine transporter subunit MdtI [Pseudomonas aeruginosa]|nr:multidrug/spermidine transporter subunit MdtI [Pseudomonas aeruginosa]
MRSWIYLLLAIGAEVIGTTSMKLAATHAPVAGMLLMYGMIGLSYFFLALAVKRVPVGVAYFAWLGLAIALEVVANLLLKYSDGFRRRGLGIASILCVMAAFTALAQAVKDIELSLAYAIWGGFGILATVAMGWALFGQRLAWRGWLGLLLLLAGMSLLKLA